MKNNRKPLVSVGAIKYAGFCAMILLGTDIALILGPSWDSKSKKNRLREGSEIDPNMIERNVAFEIDRWPIFGRFRFPTGSPRGFNKSGFWGQVSSWEHFEAQNIPQLPPRSNCHRFGLILGRFGIDFLLIFGRFVIDS